MLAVYDAQYIAAAFNKKVVVPIENDRVCGVMNGYLYCTYAPFISIVKLCTMASKFMKFHLILNIVILSVAILNVDE